MIYLREKSNSSRPAINGSNGKDGKRLYQISENLKTQLCNKKAPARSKSVFQSINNNSAVACSIKIQIRILQLLPEAIYQNTRVKNLDAHHLQLDPLYILQTSLISTR